jgi:mannose-1-phosphate guanylyltransferase
VIVPVILSGGSGTRLWPLSREHSPKQFLHLSGDRSLFQQALERASVISDCLPLVVCNEEHRFMAAEQLRQAGQRATILLEPIGRNTAPAIALAAFQAMVDFGDVDSRLRGNDKASGNDKDSEAPILLVLAADHVIQETAAFQAAVQKLELAVREGKFGTLGIVPTEPATGYGYIKAGGETSGLFTVEQFVEKPDAQTAQSYLDGECYYWNSGMFMIRADRYLEELKRHQPEMYAACEVAMANTEQDYDFVRIDKEAFIACPGDSIDYALMEPLTAEALPADFANSQVVVAPLDAGWSDVGSWSALWDIADKCEGGNSVLHTGNADGETILKDTRNSLISTSDRLVSTLGVDDLVIVDTKDALLVAHRDKVQDVKGIVAQIKKVGLGHHEFHREVYRPWGRYDAIDRGDKYQVKRISVKPGGKLSLQMHHHRAEHWVVVSGVAEVTRGGATFLLRENESTFIPVGERHSLRNPGESDLEIIEVQSGSFLSEDDIVRYEDDYGRV